MDNKIVSTTYVPLDPPYQIIKYSRDIAMQIGTLIVTIQKEGNENGLGYKIETHSHPVVSYENKFKAKPNHQLSSYNFLEGAVWNNVEVKDVTTICLTNAILPWREYVDFLWRDISRSRAVQPMIPAIWSLDKLCGGVEPPMAQHYIIKLVKDTITIDGKPRPLIRSRQDDIYALLAPFTDREKTWEYLVFQFTNYVYALCSRIKRPQTFTISYETDEEDFRDLVKTMNSFPVCTEPLNNPVSFGYNFLKSKEKESR